MCEPMLTSDVSRFVLFPIKYPKVRRVLLFLFGGLSTSLYHSAMECIQAMRIFVLDSGRSDAPVR